MSTFNLHPFKTTFKFLSSNLSSNVLERISLTLSTVLFLFKVKGYLWRRLLNGLTQKTKIGGVCVLNTSTSTYNSKGEVDCKTKHIRNVKLHYP